MADDAGAPGRVQRVAAAVMLLKRADPLRFQRIRGDCPRIGIIPTVGSGGEYWSSPKMGEEKAFARRLPNSDEWVKYVERKTLDPSYWTDAAVAARTQKAFDDLVMVPDRGTV